MSTALPMSHTRRLSSYLRQSGRAYHTPAQVRRAKHKFNRMGKVIRRESFLDQYVEVNPPTIPITPLPEKENKAILELLDTNPWDESTAPAETSGDFGPVTVPARPCGGTEYCITKTGNKASKPHVKCEVAA